MDKGVWVLIEQDGKRAENGEITPEGDGGVRGVFSQLVVAMDAAVENAGDNVDRLSFSGWIHGTGYFYIETDWFEFKLGDSELILTRFVFQWMELDVFDS